jgi:TRAP-type C4-dicarboxylate transport system substrate-binding protein
MKRIVSRFSAVFLAIVAAGILATTASAQQFTMKVSFPTINDVTHEFFKMMKAGIEQRSGGRIKVDIYPANQLGQIPAVVEGVALGTIEVGGAATGFFVGLEPRFQVFDAPGLFDDTQHAFRVLTDPEIRKRLATLGADAGVEILVAGTYGQTAMLSHKAVRGTADFQGQKVRTPGGSPIQVEPFRKLGILPVSLPLGDALPAMQNRTIDGLLTALAVYVNFKYYDIAKSVTYLPATTLLAPALINRKFLKSLGPELEAIVREEALKAEVVYTAWNVAYTKRIEEAWLKNGGELITFSPAEAKRYVDIVSPVSRQILSANPKVKEDYEVLLAAAQKYRQ